VAACDLPDLVPQQTLQTERITLVPLADEHLEWEVELDSDPEVMRHLSGRASTREEILATHARRMAAAQKVDGLGFWVGLVDDEFVGWWILQAHGTDQPDDPGVADLGFRLLPRHWRKGLASEGARELVRYGFDEVGLDRIIAQTLTVNAGSRGVMAEFTSKHLLSPAPGGLILVAWAAALSVLGTVLAVRRDVD
jgi:RimJ/RimL family protein N-acetyltransferase